MYLNPELGAANTDGVGSFWHDVELSIQHLDRNRIVPMVVEIPKGTKAKMEINKERPWNPIAQDVKKGKLREYPFPSVVHYGAIPRTYEHPKEIDDLTGLIGDGDPVDIVDVSDLPAVTGEIYWVKVLGALAMEDEGAADWKVVAIRLDDPRAHLINGEPAAELGTAWLAVPSSQAPQATQQLGKMRISFRYRLSLLSCPGHYLSLSACLSVCLFPSDLSEIMDVQHVQLHRDGSSGSAEGSAAAAGSGSGSASGAAAGGDGERSVSTVQKGSHFSSNGGNSGSGSGSGAAAAGAGGAAAPAAAGGKAGLRSRAAGRRPGPASGTSLSRGLRRIVHQLGQLKTFLRDYKKKTPDEPDPVTFAYGGSYLDAATAVNVVRHHHIHWCRLVDEAAAGRRVGSLPTLFHGYQFACDAARKAWQMALLQDEGLGSGAGAAAAGAASGEASAASGLWLPVNFEDAAAGLAAT